MSEIFRCEDKDTLVAYLYGEVEPDVRREVERHLRTCVACAREIDGLQGVRDDLQLWMPPEPEWGFTIVQNAQNPAAATIPAPVLTSPRWARLQGLPAWAQVAAAALFVAAAAALANVQVRSTSDGVVVTTGWMQPAAAGSAAPASDEWRAALVALEAGLRDELRRDLQRDRALAASPVPAATLPTPSAASATPVPASSGSEAAVLRRVAAMIAASEERQRQELALNFRRAEANWNVRRQADLASINQAFGSLQGRTIAVQAGQQELMNRFRLQRVSAPQPNQ